jgi:hypothetical protein
LTAPDTDRISSGMSDFPPITEWPDDIFTEPSDVDPDTLANLGPLTRLAGVWEGR